MAYKDEPDWIYFFIGIQKFIEGDTPFSVVKSMLNLAADCYGKEYVISQAEKLGFSELVWILEK